MKRFILSFFSTILLLWANASTIFVDIDATGSNDGTSWTNAHHRLQDGLALANSGDTLWVAEGTYYPAIYDYTDFFDWNISYIDSTFSIPNGVSVYGGFNGFETSINQRNLRTNSTILNGDINRNDQQRIPRERNLQDETPSSDKYNSYHVVTFDGSNGTLDGVHVINGGSNYRELDTTIVNPILSDTTYINSTDPFGNIVIDTAIAIIGTPYDYNFNGPNNNGGGIYIKNNSSPKIRNVFFKRNFVQQYGAAAYVGTNCTALFENCIFTENYLLDYGILYTDQNSNTSINHCTFYNNRGGNSLIFANTANTLIVSNSILWDVGYNIVNFNSISVSGTNNISYQDISGLNYSNINPLLVNPGHYDFEPIACSQAVSNADVASSLNTDIFGESRIGNADIGAVEHRTANVSSNSSNRIYVDIDATGINDGSSWANAHANIYDAVLSSHCNNIDEIWIAEGLYNISDTTQFNAIYLDKTIRMYGGFNGNEVNLSQRNIENNKTIITGDSYMDDYNFLGNIDDLKRFDNSINLLINSPYGTDSVIIDGFTFRASNALGLGFYEGGISNISRFSNGGKVKISNCENKITKSKNSILNVYSTSYIDSLNINSNFLEIEMKNCFNNSSKVGSVSNENGIINFKIDNSEFHSMAFNNISKVGGILNLDIDSTLFRSVNSIYETQGNAVINTQINGSEFLGFSGNSINVGMKIVDYGGANNMNINHSKFDGLRNVAISAISKNAYYSPSQVAGAINIDLQHTEFLNNRGVNGSCIYAEGELNAQINVTASDLLIYRNLAFNSGAFMGAKSTGGNIVNTFNNITAAYNIASDSAALIIQYIKPGSFGNISTTFNNSIIYKNFAPVLKAIGTIPYYIGGSNNPKNTISSGLGSNMTFNYCSIDTSACYENTTCGAGMQYNQDPLFTSKSNNDFRLLENSPASNSGNNTYSVGNNFDYYDSTRVQASVVDLGALEGEIFCADSVVYVDSMAIGNNDGSSWANAFIKLPDAIELANNCSSVKEIWIAQGTYFATNDLDKTKYLQILRTDLKVYGGFPNSGNPTFAERDFSAYKSIISGDLLQDNIEASYTSNISDNSELLMLMQNTDSTNTISGIHFYYAQGISLTHLNPLDESLNSNPLIEDCVFSYSTEGCINVISGQVKMPAPIINRCKFITNSDHFGGVGIILYAQGSFTGYGNGLVNNMDTTIIANCLFYDLESRHNNDSGWSGAIYSESNGNDILPVKIKSSTFTRIYGKIARVVYAKKSNIDIENCIFYKNASWPTLSVTDDQFIANNSDINIHNSSVIGANCMDENLANNGGSIQCFGNMFYDVDPLFTDEVNEDFTLQISTPLRNKGDNSLVFDSLDLKLEERIVSDTLDLGCYELPNCIPEANFIYAQVDSFVMNIQFTSKAKRADSVKYYFGDGDSSLLKNPNHLYNSSGAYDVKQIAFGACGNDTIMKTIEVICQLPEANFTFMQNNDFIRNIAFVYIAENADSVIYNFGDGNTSNQDNPIHAYLTSGTYNVCQIAYGVCGTDTLCKMVNVLCELPTAGFAFTQDQNQVNLFQFTSSAVNADSVKYHFGDGDTSILDNPSHTYVNTGEYIVCQFAYGNCGIDTICDTLEICNLNAIVYVNKIASGNNDGTSWQDAFTELDSATILANSCENIKEIWVAEGIYMPGDGNVNTFQFEITQKETFKMFGAFPNTGNPIFTDRDTDIYPTVLEGNVGVQNDSMDNTSRILVIEDVLSFTMDGFIIQNNFSMFPGIGAINIVGSDTIRISNCTIQKNNGNGMFIGQCDLVEIDDCIIQDNLSEAAAGILVSTFANGQANINNVLFKNNKALTEGLFGQGGGAMLAGDGNYIFKQCRFEDNQAVDLFGAPSPGGAINFEYSDSVYMENCLFVNNKAGDGGAVKLNDVPSEFRHCTFYGNQSNQGGFVISSSDKDVLIRNSIIWNNTSLPFGFGDQFATLGNNILFDANFIDIPNCTPVNYAANCIGGNEFNVYPMFKDTANLDLRLSTCSPAIDFSNSFHSSIVDFDNNNRPYSFLPDAGVYEWSGEGVNYQIFNNSPISNITQMADVSITDSLGWTHYYDCDSGNILLSVKLDGEDIGILGAGLDVGVNINTDYATDIGQNLSTANFHNNTHFYAMNRSWFVNTFQQPFNPVKVRFYYNSSIDLKDAATSYNNAVGSIEKDNINDLVFYKLHNTQNAYNLTTALNDANIYYWSNNASLTTWTNGTFNGLAYAEFEVSSFSAGTGAASSGLNPLPVELLNFEAKAIENEYVKLNWTTATEINNDGFFIERSLDGIEFKSMYFVQGNGSITEIKNYNYDDFDVEKNIDYYYRLKQIDFDGKFEYSEVKTARLNNNDLGQIEIYPNPTKVYINILGADGFDYKVLNINGKEVKRGQIEEIKKNLNLKDLVAGTYFLNLKSSSESKVFKIILTK